MLRTLLDLERHQSRRLADVSTVVRQDVVQVETCFLVKLITNLFQFLLLFVKMLAARAADNPNFLHLQLRCGIGM